MVVSLLLRLLSTSLGLHKTKPEKHKYFQRASLKGKYFGCPGLS